MERIVEYDPGDRMKIEFTDLGDMEKIVQELYSEWSVEEIDESCCTVRLKGRYQTKYGPIGWVVAKLMLKSMMEDLYEETLDALGKYVTESETRVDQGTTSTPQE